MIASRRPESGLGGNHCNYMEGCAIDITFKGAVSLVHPFCTSMQSETKNMIPNYDPTIKYTLVIKHQLCS